MVLSADGRRAVMAGKTVADEDRLIEEWIEPDPWKAGAAETRVRRYGMNVWALIGALGGDDGDIKDVARAYRVPVEAVKAALTYYRLNRDAIDCRLAANAL